MRVKRILQVARDANGRAWGDAALSLGCTLVVSLLPLWATLILSSALTGTATLFDRFFAHGEFMLYSAGLLGTVLYLLLRLIIFARTTFAIFILVDVVLLLVATMLYLPAVLRDNYSLSIDIGQGAYITASLVVFFLSLLMSGAFTLVGASMENINAGDLEERNDRILDEKFEQLRRQS